MQLWQSQLWQPQLWQSLAARLAVALAVLVVGLADAAAASSIESAFAPRAAAGGARVDHTAWDRQLAAYVRPAAGGLDRVAYAAWKAEGHAALAAYIAGLEAIDPATLSRPEQFAFWANLYNARTIDIVLGRYPVASIKDIHLGGGFKALVGGGPWQAQVTRVAGIALSLDDIEHRILRGLFKDPRVHYAVNCASVGCPNLRSQAFTGDRLERQLDAAARAYINSPRGFRVEGGRITASSIYSWFQADFGGSEAGVLAHAMRYAEPALELALAGTRSIAGYAYDWSLNDAR